MVILLAAFAVMFYSVFAHRRARATVAAQWHEHALVELLWTVIPVLILFGSAWPAMRNVLETNQKSTPELAAPAVSPADGVRVASVTRQTQLAGRHP